MSFVTSTVIGKDTQFGGEFGNQLFQVAAVLGYAEKYGLKAKFEYWYCSFSKRNYSPLFPKLNYCKFNLPQKIYNQSNFYYQEIPLFSPIDLRGMFQSEKYFPPRQQLLDFFQTPDFYKHNVNQILNKNKIKSYSALHIRFYDRPERDLIPVIHTLPDHYYLTALEKISHNDPILIVTNNKAKANLILKKNNISKDIIIISSTDILTDFFLLVNASRIAIGNSTFAWWAGYLNQNVETVYAPLKDKWFSLAARFNKYWSTKDLYPKNFIEIDF